VLGSNELRYVVRLEVHAAMDADLDEESEDRDYLLELHEILERSEELEDEVVGDEIYQRQRHDLCRNCFEKFVRDPLGCDPAKQLNFSKN
jgi:hypothetical protein